MREFLRSLLQFAATLAMVGLYAGCSTLSINTDWDREADFTQFSTFDWRAPDADQPLTLFDNTLRRVVNDELAAKGLTQSSDNPDLLLVSRASINEVVTGATVNHWNHSGWGWYGGWGGMTTSTVNVNSHTQGTLILDIVDMSNNQLVWRGIAEKAISGTPQVTREKMEPIVEKLLADFPPM